MRVPVDLQEYRKNSYDTWERMAAGWRERRDYLWRTSHPVGEWMVAALDPKPGQTILELAAGVGDTGFAAAQIAGVEGRLISTDFSPKMVEGARARGEELGLANVEYRVLDAERMDLDDASVDGVLCRWGYMLMADPAAALSETNRVLKPGGRLAFAVWSTPERNPFASVPALLLVERGDMPAPEPGAPGIFSMADHDRIRDLVTGAGFAEPRIEEIPVSFRFDDFDDYWSFVNTIAGPVAFAIDRLGEQDKAAVRDTLRQRVDGFRADGRVELPGVSIGVVAERPA
jgi:ubiquinone/menaquinone biosynthesis C-methylase UbiE